MDEQTRKKCLRLGWWQDGLQYALLAGALITAALIEDFSVKLSLHEGVIAVLVIADFFMWFALGYYILRRMSARQLKKLGYEQAVLVPIGVGTSGWTISSILERLHKWAHVDQPHTLPIGEEQWEWWLNQPVPVLHPRYWGDEPDQDGPPAQWSRLEQ